MLDPGDLTQTDGELLRCFAESRDEGAFRRLVDRHGGMVLRLSARLLGGDRASAEDVAQHVFTLLATRAGELWQRACVAGWLHRTTTHAALRARRDAATRARHERGVAALRPSCVHPANGDAADPIAQLHRALTGLQDEYRDALVLHHLHGYTVEQTAELLASPVGTVAARLSRGRQKLRERLASAGAVLGIEALIGWLDVHSAAAADGPVLDRVCRSAVAAPPAYTSAGPGGAALVMPGVGAAAATGATAAAGVTWSKVGIAAFLMSLASAAAAAANVAFSPASPAAAEEKKTAARVREFSSFDSRPSSDGRAYVPEPSALALLAVGAFPLLRRRRRS